jgi:AraC-like DNA-binding protein
MTDIETPRPRAGHASLDLHSVAETQRPAIWASTARAFFPGISVRTRQHTVAGSMQGAPFGPGALWTILSPPVFVRYTPPEGRFAHAQTFSLMFQLEGVTNAAQGRRTCRLCPLEFCVIDGNTPFELDVPGVSSQFMFLQIPRVSVLSRHPYLEHHTAETFDPEEIGVTILRRMLQGLVESAPLLDEDQRGVVLSAVAQLLGAPKAPLSRLNHDVGWRVRAALAYIDAELADQDLTARRVAEAQGISRRHLDEILLKSIGVSLTAQIWTRRLAQAAADLLDPRYASHRVTQIAFAAGFKDVAHFTRAFKRRYHCTPLEWRHRSGDTALHADQSAMTHAAR